MDVCMTSIGEHLDDVLNHCGNFDDDIHLRGLRDGHFMVYHDEIVDNQ